jgi:hypothetical protein
MLKFEQVQNYKHSIKYCYGGKIFGFYVAQIIIRTRCGTLKRTS